MISGKFIYNKIIMDLIQLLLNIDNNVIPVEVKKNITVKQFIDNFKLNDVFLKTHSRILRENEVFTKNETIYICQRLRGGFIDILIDMLTGMYNLLTSVGGLVEDIIGIIVNILEMIPNIFSPDKLINDVLSGIINGITSVIGMFFFFF